MTSPSQPSLLPQQKLAQLQADSIIYQDQIQRLRKKILSLQQYRIKYQLLLQQQKQQSPLHRSRRVDQINNMNKKIQENNDKWTLKVKLLESKYQAVVHEMEERNERLQKQVERLERGNLVKEKESSVSGLSQVNALREQLALLKSRNSGLSQQLSITKQANQQLTTTLQSLTHSHSAPNQHQNLQPLLQQARLQQKQFYRQAIIDLQQQVTDLNEQVDFHRERASPQRQQQIARLVSEIKRIEQQHERQIEKFNQRVSGQNEEMKVLAHTLEVSKFQSLNHIQLLSAQLQQQRQKLLASQQLHHSQLMACRLQMQNLRQQQVSLLKQSFQKIQNSHQSQRLQWQLILKEQQEQLQRIKHMWQQQRQKFSQQKNKLKAKINQLKAREKRSPEHEKSLADNETYKLITSLRQIDEQQNKYNDYESNVTFLSRQLKRATSKIQQKQRECAKLLNQLKVQRQEFETQTQFIKKMQRQQMLFYKQKLMQADSQNTKLLQQLRYLSITIPYRQKDKHIRTTTHTHRLQHQKLLTQTHQLNDILRQMQRDYSRLTDNKKNLFQQYRSQRDMVFTGKVELGQERKDKWLQLDRQKNQLEIAYKERERQIRIQYELRINELTERLNKVNQVKELASAENQILKERVNQNGEKFGQAQTEQNTKDLHKKLATLDLQISLTQNLFSTLKSVRNRSQKLKTTSQLQQLSQHQSIQSVTSNQQKIRDLQNDSLDPEQFQKDNIAPTFSRAQQQWHSQKQQQQYENFSFKPHQPMIKVTKVNKKNVTEMSFHNKNQHNGGDRTPGWGGV